MILADGPDRGDEPVASPWNGIDVVSTRVVAEGLAQQIHVLRQAVLLDERTSPYDVEEFLLPNRLTVPFDECQQQLSGLGRQRYDLLAAAEQALVLPEMRNGPNS